MLGRPRRSRSPGAVRARPIRAGRPTWKWPWRGSPGHCGNVTDTTFVKRGSPGSLGPMGAVNSGVEAWRIVRAASFASEFSRHAFRHTPFRHTPSTWRAVPAGGDFIGGNAAERLRLGGPLERGSGEPGRSARTPALPVARLRGGAGQPGGRLRARGEPERFRPPQLPMGRAAPLARTCCAWSRPRRKTPGSSRLKPRPPCRHRPAAQRDHLPAHAAGARSANRAPLSYETMQPYPDPGAGKRDRRIRRVEMQSAASAISRRACAGCTRWPPPRPRNAPRSPRTCSRSLPSTRPIRAELSGLARAAGTRGRLRLPQALPAALAGAAPQRGGTRWVLKCPDHVFALDDIRTVDPGRPLRLLLPRSGVGPAVRRQADRGPAGRRSCARWIARRSGRRWRGAAFRARRASSPPPTGWGKARPCTCAMTR